MSPSEKSLLINESYSRLKPYVQGLLDIYRLRGMRFIVLNRGSCMRPFIERGDYLDVSPLVEDYIVGDIVVLQIQGELVVHRIVNILKRKGDKLFITKGDMMLRCDKPICRDEIYGKVMRIRKVKSGGSIDCVKLSRLFSVIARISFRCVRFNETIRVLYRGQASILRVIGIRFIEIWTKLYKILVSLLV